MVNDDGDCQSKLNVGTGGGRSHRGGRRYGNFISRAEAKRELTLAHGDAADDNSEKGAGTS